MVSQGFIVESVDWFGFFVYASAMGIPGIILAVIVVRRCSPMMEDDGNAADAWPEWPVMHIDDLGDPDARGFSVGDGDWPFSGFIVRRHGRRFLPMPTFARIAVIRSI